jgi:galactokinase
MNTLNEQNRQQWMQAAFIEAYGREPETWTRAPGRVDLMGSHTDYNQGWVLTMAIDSDTWVAASPRADGWLRVRSLNTEGEALFALDAIQRDEALLWPNYVAGVAWALQDAGHPLRGCDLLVHTTVPLSSGLSSSAALEMAASVALEKVTGITLDAVTRARLGQRAENVFVGVNCGILDQYTSSVGEAGSAIALDCRALRSEAAHIASSIGVVICDTKAKRELASSQYGQRRADCEEAVRILSGSLPGITALRDVSVEQFEALEAQLTEAGKKRARFIIEENARVLALAHALEANDRPAIAALTSASFAGARDLYEITIPEMERMQESMLAAPGVLGARQAGAGFGGCMVAFVDVQRAGSFAAAVQESYTAATGLTPAIYAVRAAQGAGELRVRGTR